MTKDLQTQCATTTLTEKQRTRVIEDCAIEVEAHQKRTLEHLFAMGQKIKAARDAIGTPYRKYLYARLGMSASYISKLITISEDERLQIFSHAKKLDASVDTLYEIHRLTPEQWDRGLREDVLKQGVMRKEISSLRKITEKEESEISKYLDPDVSSLFPNPHHLRVFVRWVEKAPRAFPMSEQVFIATEMLKILSVDGVHTAGIESMCKHRATTTDTEYRQATQKQEKLIQQHKEERADFDREEKAKRIMAEFNIGVGRTSGALQQMINASDDKEFQEILATTHIHNLGKSLDRLEELIPLVRNNLTLYSQWDITVGKEVTKAHKANRDDKPTSKLVQDWVDPVGIEDQSKE